jgi:DNA modification methylase
MSLYRQKQLQEEENTIPERSITKWHLDCMKECSKSEAFEMAIRHYSCVNDEVVVYSIGRISDDLFLNRKIHHRSIENIKTNIMDTFKHSSYFYRYLQEDTRPIGEYTNCLIGRAALYHGDSYDVLRMLATESIDGAVTSPPYYNAKTYSQWKNIYCYLYDMYNISREIYRVLKNGAVYLFNIFDYFDNENNISLSAMGNKRMILGAYMIDIFQRIGFEIVGNMVWNKGEIQGNRSFNQGNLTPYYQAPLNCWEHIIILSKGKPDNKYSGLVSQIKDIRPVVKMIKGKNVLGHDAPYPNDIPELIIKCMKDSDVVLDPFLGSGTTAIVANRYGINSIGIEKSDTYYELCKERIWEDIHA